MRTTSSVTLNETCSSLLPGIVSDEELGGLFSLLDVALFKFFQKKNMCVHLFYFKFRRQIPTAKTIERVPLAMLAILGRKL